MRPMPQTDETVALKVEVPPHVQEVLHNWALNELHKESEAVLETIAYELCYNAELRTLVAELVAE
jgi:transcription termination factor NusB